MFYEIIKRSARTGGESEIISGFLDREAAEKYADKLQEETEDFWFEVREQR